MTSLLVVAPLAVEGQGHPLTLQTEILRVTLGVAGHSPTEIFFIFFIFFNKNS